MFWILQAFGPRILNILKWHICVVEQAILFWISTKTICKKSPVTIQPNHLPSSSKARSKGTALPSPSLGAAKVPWLFVPEKPKEEVPANARVVFHSMILLGMMTFFGKGRLLVVKKNGSLKQLCKLCAFFFSMQSGSREICEIDIGIHLLQVQVLRHDPANQKSCRHTPSFKCLKILQNLWSYSKAQLDPFAWNHVTSHCAAYLCFSVTPIL